VRSADRNFAAARETSEEAPMGTNHDNAVDAEIKANRPVDLDEMLEGYIECALWACTIPTDEEGTPVDPGIEEYEDTPAEDTGLDLSEEARNDAREDCEGFVDWCEEQCPEALEEYLAHSTSSGLGHDFHLSRNGHGAGFFDRGFGECDDVLQKAAKIFGTHDLMADGPEGPLSFHG